MVCCRRIRPAAVLIKVGHSASSRRTEKLSSMRVEGSPVHRHWSSALTTLATHLEHLDISPHSKQRRSMVLSCDNHFNKVPSVCGNTCGACAQICKRQAHSTYLYTAVWGAASASLSESESVPPCGSPKRRGAAPPAAPHAPSAPARRAALLPSAATRPAWPPTPAPPAACSALQEPAPRSAPAGAAGRLWPAHPLSGSASPAAAQRAQPAACAARPAATRAGSQAADASVLSRPSAGPCGRCSPPGSATAAPALPALAAAPPAEPCRSG